MKNNRDRKEKKIQYPSKSKTNIPQEIKEKKNKCNPQD
jgi:hypothetical protein